MKSVGSLGAAVKERERERGRGRTNFVTALKLVLVGRSFPVLSPLLGQRQAEVRAGDEVRDARTEVLLVAIQDSSDPACNLAFAILLSECSYMRLEEVGDDVVAVGRWRPDGARIGRSRRLQETQVERVRVSEMSQSCVRV